MSMCVDFDTANFEQIPESERSKTTVLSRQSTDILCECWKTWRLSSSFRTMVYLNLIISKFDQNQVGFEEVDEAMQWLEKVIEENDLNSWTIADVSFFFFFFL